MTSAPTDPSPPGSAACPRSGSGPGWPRTRTLPTSPSRSSRSGTPRRSTSSLRWTQQGGRQMPATTASLRDLYRSMVLIREAEETLLRLFSQNRMPGFIHSYIGEEATAVRVRAALLPDDYLTSTHRRPGHIPAKADDLRPVFSQLYWTA